MTLAEIWARFMAAALTENAGYEHHMAERAEDAARIADFAMDEFRRRFPKYKAPQS